VSAGRAIPPAAAPVTLRELADGIAGIVRKDAQADLEKGLREHFGVRHALLASSGKAALYLVLKGLNALTGRRKVIIPAYTCFSVPSAVRFAGLEIVPCDVVPETLDFDYSLLRELIGGDTLCVISTHLFGIPADTAKAREMCVRAGAFAVEDAAQAMGGVREGKKLGTLGDVGFFSLGRGKNITCGSGGVVITSSDEIAAAVRAQYDTAEDVPPSACLKTFLEIVFMMVFLRPRLFWIPKRLPFLKLGETHFHASYPVRRFTGFQAGLLAGWPAKLERLNRVRAMHGDRYRKRLGLAGRMPIYSGECPYNRFPVFAVDRRTKEAMCSEWEDLGITPMYPSAVHRIPELRGCFEGREYPGADRVSDTLVTLPTHVLLDDRDIEKIGERVAAYGSILREAPCT